MLDHWKAARAVPERAIVVHVHGGGWIAGSKGRFYTKPLMRLADAGHPVFSLNYPLAPETRHPEPLRALLRGLAWIKRTQSNGGAVHLIGDSAGGNLVMMLAIMAANPQILRGYDGMDPTALPEMLSVSSLFGLLDRISFQEDRFPGAGLFLRSYAGPAAIAPEFSTPMPITPLDLPTIARLPRGLDFAVASVLPITGVTAASVLDKVKFGPGMRVLINGAAGGIGIFVTQFAIKQGAEVTAVASAQNAALLQRWGAARVVDYRHSDVQNEGLRYDVIIDLSDTLTLAKTRPILMPEGSFVASLPVPSQIPGGLWNNLWSK